jgi:hypothetical protein
MPAVCENNRRVDGMRSMVTKSGNDRIYTPDYLAKEIVEHFKPIGKILEPCCGEGAFLKYLPTADWCEIDKGRDFMLAKGKWDWIITNPPYSKYRDFLSHSFDLADNIVFLQFVNAFFMRKRVGIMRDKGFEIKEILYLSTPPKPWPQTGFQVGCIYWTKS